MEAQNSIKDESVFNALLQKSRPLLVETYEDIDPLIPRCISALRRARAPECYHKHGTFFDHLVGVYRALECWNVPHSVARCGLFHSAYSNSIVNLAIFKPDIDRQVVRDLIGSEAEELVHMYCIVPRIELTYDMVLGKYTDKELVADLEESENFLSSFDVGNCSRSITYDGWRKKLQGVLPPEGIVVKHFRTGDDLIIPRRLVALFLLLTMADLSEQMFGYVDVLFDNENGRLDSKGNTWKALWPGDGKPGLWMNAVSRMGAVYTLIAREEKIFRKDEEKKFGFEHIELTIPPVFNNCTTVFNPSDQIQARDLYWEAICKRGDKTDEAEALLLKACVHNPFIGEPHLVLAQIYLSGEKYEEAEKEAKIGLKLLLEWGCNWDKRTSWEGWISWGRVMLDKAKEKTWPKTSWGIINLGFVNEV